MNKCSGYTAVDKDEAIANLIQRCKLFPGTEVISLADAVSRVAAGRMVSKHDLPAMNSSRMDGIAVCYRDFENGAPDTSGWTEGKEYVFCNCGIGIPGPYDTVIRIEDVEFPDGKLTLLAQPSARGQWMKPPGTSVKKDEVLVEKGDVLTPFLISRIAMGGYAAVEVIKKPVVAFIPTGDELVPAGEPVPPGMNVDSNSLMVRGKILLWGGEPLIYPINRDDPEVIRATMADALEKADIVVVNAGSSQGQKDYTMEVLEQFGTVLSHMIKSGPGAHTSCTVAHSGKPIVGIPGPAVGAESVVDWFLKPLMDMFLGQKPQQIFVRAVYTGEEIPYTAPSNGTARMARVILTRREDGRLAARTVSFENADETNRANGFLRITSEGVRPGEEVKVELRYPYSFI